MLKSFYVSGGNMKFEVNKWIKAVCAFVLFMVLLISTSMFDLPVLSSMGKESILFLIIFPMWTISFVIIIVLLSIVEIINNQNKLMSRLEHTFKVEEQKRIDDPLSRF